MNDKLKTITLFVGVLIIGLMGCTTKKEAKPPVRDYGVVGSFDTGQGVIVRALKVDGPYLWVGTSTGILQVEWKSGNLVKTYTREDGLLSNYIFTINVSQDGVRWFGTDAGGLSRFDGKVWKTYMPEDGLSDEWVYDIAYDRSGAMWVGTWDGVSRFDGSEFITYRVKDGLANKWVYSVAVDHDGTLWFGTEEGISHFDLNAPAERAWTTYTHRDGLGAPNELALSRKKTASYEGHFHDLSPLDDAGNETYNKDYVFAILVDRNGNKWFGTWGGGASRFNGKTWKNFTAKDGLAGNIVYALEEDSLGQIWAGTHRGVSVYNGASWRSYTQTQGLKESDVFAVVSDPNQNIWVGQKGGVIQLGPKQG